MKISSEKIILKEKKINNENNNNEYSEIICQMIIKKIISKVISQTNNDKVYSKLNDHCFDFIINSIDPFLSTNFIFHENSNRTNNTISKNFFYSIIPQNTINTWIEIKEPNLPEFDRYHSNKTKIVKNTETNNVIQKNNNIEKESNNTESKNNIENTSNRNLNRIDNKLNTLKEAIELDSHFNSNNNSNSNSEIKIEEKDKLGVDNRENEKKVSSIGGQTERLRKKTKSLIIDLPYYDLPKEVYENKYIALNNNEENNLLRIEREREIMIKEQEKNLEKIKNKKDYYKSRLMREFDSNKITFDSNGCIINLNIPNVDSFSNDFYIPKPVINDLKFKNISFYFNKENKSKTNISKKMKLMKFLSANIPTINKKYSSTKDNTLNTLNKNIRNFEKKSSQKINFISKFKIMNPSYSLNSLTNQKKKIKIEYNQTIEEEEKKKKLKIKLPPSGSNFDKIIPEVGVIIQNNTDNQTKKGGFEYFNKYNKPSINEFKQLVDETLKLNNKIKTSHLSNNSLKKNIKSENSFEYNGYNQDFIEGNNPLIQNPVVSISNLKFNNIKNDKNNKSLTKNKSQLDSNAYSNDKVFFKSFDNKMKNKNLFNKIILSQKNIVHNLYNVLTRRNDEEDEDEIEKNENGNKNKNIFKTLKKRSFSNLYKLSENIIKNNNFFSLIPFKRKIRSPNKILSLPNIIETKKTNSTNMEYGEEIIDNFNSKILKNKNWGEFFFSERNTKLGYEPKNIFRKQYKLNDNKEIIEKRHRVPHSMVNKNNEKSHKI